MIRYINLIMICMLYCCQSAYSQSETTVEFKFSFTPTSTYNYTYEVTNKLLIVKTWDKILKKNSKERKVKKVVETSFKYEFNSNEALELGNLIENYHLDSIDLYKERKTKWGSVWEVKIKRDSITYTISLPNYSNDGLEALLKFLVNKIPEEELPKYG